MGWTVRESNPGGGEIFHTRPDCPWGPPRLLYNGNWVSFPEVKRPGRGVDHLPPSCAEVKERAELYLYLPLCLHDLFQGEYTFVNSRLQFIAKFAVLISHEGIS